MSHLPDTLYDRDRWTTELGGADVIFGEGSLDRLGELAVNLGARRVLVVTDPGIEKAGHVAGGLASLERSGLAAQVFDGVEENPTTEHVAAGVEAARAFRADLLVGLGGGSSMDTAKGVNFLLTNGGAMEDYWGVGKAKKPMLPSIGVPTTAGTGSEAQSFALISQPENHVKMACGDRKARFRGVILDPALTVSMPRDVAATTGVDALSHAVESYVTRSRNPISQLFAREAWRLLAGSFERSLEQPKDLAARQGMLLGAFFAGAAIERSMLGAAHSCANPLTARFGVVHGHAVALMLPAVVRFNGALKDQSVGQNDAAEDIDELYGHLLEASGISSNGHGNAERLSARLAELREAAGLPSTLAQVGVGGESLGTLAEEAARQWTASFNPRPLTAGDFESLYREALGS